jgi:hypothetical protein
MLTTGTQNLPEPLARVQAAYHGTARLAPASADRLAHVGEPDVSVPFELWVMGRMTVSLARRAGRRGQARPARQARLRGRSP